MLEDKKEAALGSTVVLARVTQLHTVTQNLHGANSKR
jgi:hypothetical protein